MQWLGVILLVVVAVGLVASAFRLAWPRPERGRFHLTEVRAREIGAWGCWAPLGARDEPLPSGARGVYFVDAPDALRAAGVEAWPVGAGKYFVQFPASGFLTGARAGKPLEELRAPDGSLWCARPTGDADEPWRLSRA